MAKNRATQYFVILAPIIYLSITIFLLRSKVQYYFLASALLILVTALFLWQNNSVKKLQVGHWLAVLAAIGLSASTILLIEKVELLIEPSRITSCSISPIVACSPVITSDQASAFGFPNPIIGVFGFAAVFTAGMTILAGARNLHKAWWRTLLTGTVLGVGFSAWLIFQALYRINSLCLYCMGVWIVSIGLLWVVLAAAIDNKSLNLGRLNTFFERPLTPLVYSYLVLFGLIFIHWSDYWTSLF